VINQEFTPSKAEALDALALIAAFEEHAKKGAGAFAWKGQMMDQPHLTRAKKIAERLRAGRPRAWRHRDGDPHRRLVGPTPRRAPGRDYLPSGDCPRAVAEITV
jgi:hypothetical protein